jgi:hypothetical protein
VDLAEEPRNAVKPYISIEGYLVRMAGERVSAGKENIVVEEHIALVVDTRGVLDHTATSTSWRTRQRDEWRQDKVSCNVVSVSLSLVFLYSTCLAADLQMPEQVCLERVGLASSETLRIQLLHHSHGLHFVTFCYITHSTKGILTVMSPTHGKSTVSGLLMGLHGHRRKLLTLLEVVTLKWW